MSCRRPPPSGTMPAVTVHDLTEALLRAQATYQRARDKHDTERTELSRRVLTEARTQLDRLEEQATVATHSEAPSLPCRECGGKPRKERWVAKDSEVRDTVEDGVTVRTVTGAPGWAVGYALQGLDTVTRYTCEQCGAEIAVLARDAD